MTIRSSRQSTEVAAVEDPAIRASRAQVDVAVLGDATLRATRLTVEVAWIVPSGGQGKSRRVGLSFNRGQGP